MEAVKDIHEDDLEKNDNTLEVPVKKKDDDTVAGIVALVIMGLLIYWAWSWAFGDDQLYKTKSQVQADISTMVGNGANLDSLKHYFSTTFDQEWGLFYRWNNEKSDHYREDVSLLTVLKDIKNQGYLKGSTDSNNMNNISALIAEYQQRNPFDGLEINQKDLFDNIRVKLDENYLVVSNDLNKLSDELSQKNKLVTQYLSDSQTSLYISIASLAFGVVFPVVSLLFSRRKSSNKLLKRN
ncbi:hypothetical protein L1264_08655 [Pseudoalteromonas sp. APAL1]|uniref:hypothetical protein n=1 Tax=Pseudoalteromonas TaxID=53246 RepID=UPI000EC3CDAD|nr:MULTISPECIES: hypothetical protein [unclassified Pseudoalteromonas]MCF2920546.1 hypothetical protein [Pseudoalteromonas sp. APAL1]HCV03242.1 hypothetical protein [Pseudoalteromonas sp.]|tara:strand:- start:4627 stop:5343 length:717 start_codon:yes stop_codon:yes gene_type:complete